MKIKQEILLIVEVDYDEEIITEDKALCVIEQCIDQGIDKAYNWSYDFYGLSNFYISEDWK